MNTAETARCKQSVDPAEQAPLAKRLGRFVLALAIFWVIIYVVAPIPVKYFAPLRNYAAVVDKTDIKPGALYYSDVAQSLDSEVNNRDAIRYFVSRQTKPSN